MQTTVKFTLVTESAVDDLLAFSFQNPSQVFAVFKHSTRCSISSMALNRMNNSAFFNKNEVPFYYLDLIEYRNVSNYVAQKLQINHESPQIILLKAGKVIDSTSHNDIRESWLEAAIGANE
jgi:bacillithiol system protein YtxJ